MKSVKLTPAKVAELFRDNSTKNWYFIHENNDEDLPVIGGEYEKGGKIFSFSY